MVVNRGRTYEKKTVLLDGNEYTDCTFIDCRLVYSGSGKVGLSGCRLVNSTFHFEGAAGNAMAFLNALAGDPGLRGALPYIIPNLERRGRVN